SEELAWAGGFFDGEGSTCLDKHRTHAGYQVPVLYVPQSAETGIAPELVRLQKALGIGTISGLRKSKPPWKPYRRWRVFSVEKVFLALHMLWPFIGSVKRAQARHAMQVCTRAARSRSWQSRVRCRGCTLLPARSRQVERAHPPLQRAREERRRSVESLQAMYDMRARGCAREENQKATAMRPSLTGLLLSYLLK